MSTACPSLLLASTALLGLLIGGSLNELILRATAGQKSGVPGRARRASCGRGPIRDPLVVTTTGVCFTAVTWWWLIDSADPALGDGASAVMLIAYLHLAAVSIALARIDLDTSRLPNGIVLPSLLVFASLTAAASLLDAEPRPLLRALCGGAALAAWYGAFVLIRPGALGMGDVKLAVLLGTASAWLGWGQLVIGALATFVLGGMYGSALLLTRRAGRGSGIPFGPWMIIGAWAGMITGEGVAAWWFAS
ncbi:prepilin peptidase [Leucobacter triazinivorans]|uniref:Prepilin peptidase n=1 Tax=Leucobacter triazinivorans TaxID=1784719 RepID=A0A4P6KF44_9MICO|nr:A24 family peptidase [Leucobacter triazinivorans]QBE48044.1 prepilin peptidase [Leucobacter triazinivorans]